MAWTRFMDMHSGGRAKEEWEYIYIEAPEDEARVIFYNRFGHSPDRVTCTCCGEDYSYHGDSETLEDASGYDRNCHFDEDANAYIEEPSRSEWPSHRDFISFQDWLKGDGQEFKLVYAADIKPEERAGSVPAQGYVWTE